MANNRLYLRCKGCKKALFLGKRFGGPYFWENYYNKSLEDTLNEFYEKHYWCGGDVDNFETVYEMDDDFEEKVDF